MRVVRAAVISLIAGAAALLILRLVRGYPWSLAAIAAVAVAVLVAAGFRTFAQLARVWGPRGR